MNCRPERMLDDRWRSFQLELDDTQAAEIALVENIQREDLSPLEVAEALEELVDKHGLTQEEIATRFGWECHVTAQGRHRTLSLKKLTEEQLAEILTLLERHGAEEAP